MVETLRENLQIRFANLVVHIRKRLEAVIVTVGAASNKYRVQGLRTWTWLCFPNLGKKICSTEKKSVFLRLWDAERRFIWGKDKSVWVELLITSTVWSVTSACCRESIKRLCKCHNYYCLRGLSVTRSNGFDWPLQMLLNGWMHSWRADVNRKCGTHTLGYVVKTTTAWSTEV